MKKDLPESEALYLLRDLLARYGSLNAAHVALQLRATPDATVSEIARMTGLSRDTVRRHMAGGGENRHLDR